jgi:ribosomal protein S11
MAAVAMRPNFVAKVSAGRVANHTVRRVFTGIEVRLEGVQEGLKNANGTLLRMNLSISSKGAWSIQVL